MSHIFLRKTMQKQKNKKTFFSETNFKYYDGYDDRLPCWVKMMNVHVPWLTHRLT